MGRSREALFGFEGARQSVRPPDLRREQFGRASVRPPDLNTTVPWNQQSAQPTHPSLIGTLVGAADRLDARALGILRSVRTARTERREGRQEQKRLSSLGTVSPESVRRLSYGEPSRVFNDRSRPTRPAPERAPQKRPTAPANVPVFNNRRNGMSAYNLADVSQYMGTFTTTMDRDLPPRNAPVGRKSKGKAKSRG